MEALTEQELLTLMAAAAVVAVLPQHYLNAAQMAWPGFL